VGTTVTHTSGLVYRSGATGAGGDALSDNFLLIGGHILDESAHGATSANTASKIVKRGASGEVAVGAVRASSLQLFDNTAGIHPGGSEYQIKCNVNFYSDGVFACNGAGINGAYGANIGGTANITGGLLVAGNVGIGTASPDAILDVEKSHTVHTDSFVRLTNTSATGQTPLDFYINGTLRGKVRADYVGNLSFVANGGSIFFFTGGDAGTGTVNLRVTSGGLVAVGTGTPVAKLHVFASGEEVFRGINVGGWTQFAVERDNNGNQVAMKLIPAGSAAPGNPIWYMALPPGSTSWALQTYDGTDLLSRVTVTAAGDVGIGTASPQHLLQVGGGIPSSVDHVNLKLGVRNGIAVSNSSGKTVYTYMGEGLSYGIVEAYDYAAAAGFSLALNPSGGSVGVGTSTPGFKLDVQGTYGAVNIVSTGGSNGASLRLTGHNSNAWSFDAQPNAGGNANDLALSYNNAAKVTFTDGGDVGIGTASPGYKLDVAGSFHSTTVAATTSVTAPVTAHASYYYYLDQYTAHLPQTRVDGGVTYDQRALITSSGSTTISGYSGSVYQTSEVSGNADGWVEACVTAFNTSTGAHVYIRKRWYVRLSSFAVGTTEVLSENVDASATGSTITLTVSSGNLDIQFNQPGYDNTNISWTVQHKFDYAGTGSGGY
jgi:hypothetical protein